METKGFTLIELIIVIGIIALLATTVILVINPAALFREARDSQRIADFGQLNTSMGLYLASVGSPNMSVGAETCGWDNGAAVVGSTWWASISALGDAAKPFAQPVAITASKTITAANMRTVIGNGWVPVNFAAISSGSPLPALPVDPRNVSTGGVTPLTTTGSFYAYQCDDTTLAYEFDTNMESVRFANGGSDDIESTDGGSAAGVYEIGTNLSL